MNSLGKVLAASLLTGVLVPALFGDEDWTRHGFTAPAQEVYQAAKKVVSLHYELKSSDDRAKTLRFHIGTTAWSWGYNVGLSVESTGQGTSEARVAIEKSGGPVFSWGSGKKEIRKMWGWISEELGKAAREEAAKNKD